MEENGDDQLDLGDRDWGFRQRANDQRNAEKFLSVQTHVSGYNNNAFN